MKIIITGQSKIYYRKEVEVTEDEFHALVLRARERGFDTLREYVDPMYDVTDEEGDDDDWTIEGPDGIDALDG